MMHLSFSTLVAAAWSALTLTLAASASAQPSQSPPPNIDPNLDLPIEGQSEFHMGVLLPRQQGRANLQVFAGALGGASAPGITNSGDPERPFEVDGDTFRDFDTAANRACDNQKNACADIANGGSGAAFEVGDCDRQTEQCKSTASSATVKSFPPPELVSSNGEFDFFCEV